MKNRLTIQLGNNKIVAEIYDWNAEDLPLELSVFLEDKDGNIIQDICTVRPHVDTNKEFKPDNDFVDCIVWGDCDDEDYTDKFVIGIHEEEEN